MKFVHSLLATAMAVSITGVAQAAVSPEQAAKLGTTLTRVGAEKAANAAGTIPEYTGGMSVDLVVPGFKKGDSIRPDPFANETPRLVITSKNMAEHKDQLTNVTQELLARFPGYQVNVYPTHRSVALPDWFLNNTLKNATGTKTLEGGLAMENFMAGVPYPIPNNGYEAMWNHIVRYQGVGITGKYDSWNVDASGSATLATTGVVNQEWPQNSEALRNQVATPDAMSQQIRIMYTAPARRAGEAILVRDTIDPLKQPRRAWQYLPGQRRVKLAPDIAYDTPNPGTIGTSTYDDAFVFNGAMDRFDMKLVGKKEMYIPYNSYKLTFEKDVSKYLVPNYIEPELTRWELHRVWVVEATLKPNARHIYHKRTFYIDEDSWIAVASDEYDAREQLFRGSFAYITPSWDQQAPNPYYFNVYDLIGGAYNVQGAYGPYDGIKYLDPLSKAQWSPESLAGSGIR